MGKFYRSSSEIKKQINDLETSLRGVKLKDPISHVHFAVKLQLDSWKCMLDELQGELDEAIRRESGDQ